MDTPKPHHKYKERTCTLCNKTVNYFAYGRHLKSNKHIQNSLKKDEIKNLECYEALAALFEIYNPDDIKKVVLNF